jgi:hypothetical protein
VDIFKINDTIILVGLIGRFGGQSMNFRNHVQKKESLKSTDRPDDAEDGLPGVATGRDSLDGMSA